MIRLWHRWKRKPLFWAVVFLGALVSPFLIHQYIYFRSHNFIYASAQAAQPKYTAILLGSQVYASGRLSSFMRLRSDKAIELYRAGKVKRILVSGDHGSKDYDEVNAIKNYLVSKGVPTVDIFMDHAGFDTYDSMVRAKEVFQVDEAIIVTQGFHLPRAIYIARAKGLDVRGVPAADPSHLDLRKNRWREVPAGVKAFLDVLFNVSPTFLGEAIPITGSSKPTYD